MSVWVSPAWLVAQLLPPLKGLRLVQVLVWVIVPDPQVAEQVPSAQDDQPPLTAEDTITNNEKSYKCFWCFWMHTTVKLAHHGPWSAAGIILVKKTTWAQLKKQRYDCYCLLFLVFFPSNSHCAICMACLCQCRSPCQTTLLAPGRPSRLSTLEMECRMWCCCSNPLLDYPSQRMLCHQTNLWEPMLQQY